jgi:hypothetical protein
MGVCMCGGESERGPLRLCGVYVDMWDGMCGHSGGRERERVSEKDIGVQIWRYWVRVRGSREAGFEQSSMG